MTLQKKYLLDGRVIVQNFQNKSNQIKTKDETHVQAGGSLGNLGRGKGGSRSDKGEKSGSELHGGNNCFVLFCFVI